MQLDAEEDENAFYKPPVEPSARTPDNEVSEARAAALARQASEDSD
jgi:sorting nexin-1/2